MVLVAVGFDLFMQPNSDVAPVLLSSLKPEATVVSPNGIQQDLSIRSLCSSLRQSSRVLRPVQGSQLWTGPSAGLTRRRPTCSATSLQRFSEHCAAVKGHSCPQKRDVTAASLQLCDSSTCWRCSDPDPLPPPLLSRSRGRGIRQSLSLLASCEPLVD